MDRDVNFKSNGQGYILTVGDEPQRLSPAEAEDLFCEILKTLPGIQERVKLAWAHRTDPTIRLVGFYGISKDDKLEVNLWRGEVWVCGEQAFYTRKLLEKEKAVSVLREMYGRDLIVAEEVIFEASRAKAKEKLVLKQAKAYAESQGMTIDELWAEVRKAKREGVL